MACLEGQCVCQQGAGLVCLALQLLLQHLNLALGIRQLAALPLSRLRAGQGQGQCRREGLEVAKGGRGEGGSAHADQGLLWLIAAELQRTAHLAPAVHLLPGPGQLLLQLLNGALQWS